MASLKQSTTYSRTFFMVSSSDHIAAKTGAAPVVNIAKAGGAFGAAAGVVTELTNGWYKVALTTADTGTLGDLSYHVTGTGADDTDFVDQVFAKTVDDLMSTFTLPTNFSALSITAAGLVDITQAAADKVWSSATRTLTALGASLVQEIWDRATSALTTVGSIGKRLADDIDATISSRMAAFTLPTNFAALVIDANGRVDISKWLGAAVNALVSGRVDASAGAMAAGVLNRAALAADTGLQSARSNTAQAGTASTITLDAGASAVDQFYTGAMVIITGGTGVGQGRVITDYVGATKIATIGFQNWFTNPDGTSTFAILPMSADAATASYDLLFSVMNPSINTIKAKTDQLTFTTANKVDSSIRAAADLAQAAADKVWLTAARTITGTGAAALTAASFGTGSIDANALATDAVNEIRDTILAAVIEGAITLQQSLRLSNAALGGKSNGHAAGTPNYRDLGDLKNRVAAVTDVDGNRTTVTLDLT